MVSLGIAKGAIQIGLEQLQRQRQVVTSIARQMGTAFEKSFQGASSAVLSFDKRLSSLGGRLNSIQGELTAISVAGTAFNVIGLKTADTARLIEARYRAITGSQEDALALMNQIADAARRAGLPVRQTQQDFAGLIPILRETGGDLEQYISLVTRLSTLNPQEGTSGAIFAVREALSSGGTDLVSLSERFNIPRKTLRELIAETGNFGDALDIALDKLGATAELSEEVSRGLGGASARFRDAGSRALERGFTPYVAGAASALDGLASAIESAPDGLVQLGAGASIAVTGIAATTLALSQLISSYQNLKKAGFFEGFANIAKNPGVQRAGVGIAAAAVGTGIGIAGVRAAGRATGNERLANFDLQQAGETLKQALFLIVNALIEGGRLIAQVFGDVIGAFQTIPHSFNTWRAQMEIAFAGILIAFEDAKRFLTGDTRQRGARGEGGFSAGVQSNRLPETEGDRLLAQGLERLSVAQGNINAVQQRNDYIIDTAFDDLQLAAARAFGFIAAEAEAVADAVVDHEATVTNFINAVDAIQQKANAEFLAGLQERVSFEQDYLELLREGSPEQIQDRIQALADEKAAIEQFLPELERIAATTPEAAAALAEYQARLETIEEHTTRFGDAMITAATKAIGILDSEFTAEVTKIEAEREKAIGEAFADLQKGLGELDADVLKKSRELGAENVEALQEYQDAERDIIAKHREKVLEIERKTREDVTDAAARLDAAGVFSAKKRGEEQISEANKSLNEERAKNQEKLAETQKNLAAEALELQTYYMERRNQLITENQTELMQLNAKFNAEISTAQTAYQTERNQLQSHLNAQLAARQAAQARENSILSRGLNYAQNALSNFTNNLARQMGSLQAQRQAGSLPGALLTANSVAPAMPTFGSKSSFAFHGGGVADTMGRSEAFALVKNREGIMTPQQTSDIQRLVSFISGSQSPASGNSTPSRVAVDVTGVESFEALVQQTAMQVLAKYFQAQVTG